MNRDSKIVEVRDVYRSFGERSVLAGVSFALEVGEWAVLSGKNGAGKSTLLRLIAGVLLPDRGELRLGGSPPREAMRSRELRAGVLLPESFLYNDFTVLENLQLAARCVAANDAAVSEIASAFELEPFFASRLRNASQGVHQKTALARCLLGEPALYLLDEPFSHLDSSSTEKVAELLHRKQIAGATILCILHEQSSVRAFRPRQLELHRGRIAGSADSMDRATRNGVQ